MYTTIIEQTDEEGKLYKWIAVDEETARELYKLEIELYFVREDAEGRINDYDDLEEAIGFDSVCIEDSYLWLSEYEEGAQNRFRDNNNQSFEDWCIDKIESYY